MLSHEDPDDVLEPMMLTHDDDGDRAILEMPIDDAAPGDGGAIYFMVEPMVQLIT